MSTDYRVNTESHVEWNAYTFFDMIYNQIIILKLQSSEGDYFGYFQENPTMFAEGNSLEEAKKNLREVALQCGKNENLNPNLTDDQLLQSYLLNAW
jgi:predicted RNase H-like HicB family nuclease